jgi:hypothetical protein
MSTNARDEQIKAVLLDAAKLVEQGWCQGVPTAVIDGRRCYCAVYAICIASGGGMLSNHAVDAVKDHLGLERRIRFAVWNDALERTQAEVVAAFRGAAESLEKESGE